MDIFIIPCPQCGVKNRIKNCSPDQIPVCSKCRTRLVSEEENKTHVWFADNLKKFQDLPDINTED